MQLHCYTTLFSNWDFLKDSSVLSNERLEEVKLFCAADQYVPAQLIDGREIKDWWVHKPTCLVFNKHAMEHAEHYRNTEILSEFLTDDEVAAINSRADSIISAQQDQKRFEKAEKLKEEDWNGPVYCDSLGYNEGYFNDLNDLHEYLEGWEDDEGDKSIIEFVWTCEVNPSCVLNVDSILESATEEAHESFDYRDLHGLDELRAAVDKFNKLNENEVSWVPNFKKCVILNK